MIKLVVVYRSRIDKYIAQEQKISRIEVQNLIKEKRIAVNQKIVRKPSFIVNPNQIITFKQLEIKPSKVLPQNLPLNIVYEDDDVIVINKETNQVVHPSPGHMQNTLVNGLVYHYQKLSNLNGPLRPGTIHRLDKDTSGLILFAKNNQAHQFLANELKKRQIKRIYYAWVKGVVKQKIIHIKLPIGRDSEKREKMKVQTQNAKEAITHVYLIKVKDHKYSLVKCELETGRTHQIRVHLAYINHPIVGDPKYGQKIDHFGQRLHAYQIEFQHPTTKKWLTFKASPPKTFDQF